MDLSLLFDGLTDNRRQVSGRSAYVEQACLNTRDIQQIVDEPIKPLYLMAGVLKLFCPSLKGCARLTGTLSFALEQAEHPSPGQLEAKDNGRYGRFEFVTHQAQEGIHLPIGFSHGPFIAPSLGDITYDRHRPDDVASAFRTGVPLILTSSWRPRRLVKR